MKKLSIIIVSYNTSSLLYKCLESVVSDLNYSGLEKDTEIVVVDNASNDNSVEIVKKNFPKVKLIINCKNNGFAYANNQGIKISEGEYVLLLNSDTRVRKNCISQLVQKIEIDSHIAVVGPKILNNNGALQYSFGYFPSLIKIFLWMTFLDDIPIFTSLIKPYHVINPIIYQATHEVDWVSGACLLFRKKIVNTCGYLDEKIFMYTEEVEWCYRIKKKEYKIIYYPLAEIFHGKGESSSDKNLAGIDKEFQGLLYYHHKHMPKWQYPFVKLLLIFGALLRLFLFGIIGGNHIKAKLYAQAIKVAGR